jgi:hypothetical protein
LSVWVTGEIRKWPRTAYLSLEESLSWSGWEYGSASVSAMGEVFWLVAGWLSPKELLSM